MIPTQADRVIVYNMNINICEYNVPWCMQFHVVITLNLKEQLYSLLHAYSIRSASGDFTRAS